MKNCPHCGSHSSALKYLLLETKNFRVVCDVHPIIEGHILIISKNHLSCVGEYSQEIFDEFTNLYEKFSRFIKDMYSSVSSFEHGKIGQTVFHSHTHIIPYSGNPGDIIPEGEEHMATISSLESLQDMYRKDGKYLFFSIGKDMWLVDLKLGAPRFFRDRFAAAFGNPERGDWKEMKRDVGTMAKAQQELGDLQGKWTKYNERIMM